MVALPDTLSPDMTKTHQNAPKMIGGTGATNQVKRALHAAYGVGTLLAALGIWIVPVEEGDTAMHLVKMVFSVSMLVLGMLFISALDNRHSDPEIVLDLKKRQLRIVKLDSRGKVLIEGIYKLDDLSDITLRDQQLTARDARGDEIVSVTVRSAEAAQAIRTSLDQLG